jgi:hypothetical protein
MAKRKRKQPLSIGQSLVTLMFLIVIAIGMYFGYEMAWKHALIKANEFEIQISK